MRTQTQPFDMSWHIHACSHCNTLQHTATLCNTLQHRNTLEHIATHCNTGIRYLLVTHCNTLQHTATHCNTLQHTATQGFGIYLWHRTGSWWAFWRKRTFLSILNCSVRASATGVKTLFKTNASSVFFNACSVFFNACSVPVCSVRSSGIDRREGTR